MSNARILNLGLLLLAGACLMGQSGRLLQTHTLCGHPYAEVRLMEGFKFADEAEAREILQDIVDYVGLQPQFVVQSAQVENAAAVLFEGQRYILYNPDFIRRVEYDTRTRWSSISILAHEVGHHLNGHTLDGSGDRPRMELEADEFSGFILQKMGASLPEAQAAMALISNPYGTSTHPPRHDRLEAIRRGWEKALDQSRLHCPTPTLDSEDFFSGEDQRPRNATHQVILINNPGKRYFLTRDHRFVKLDRNAEIALGTLQTHSASPYPFVIQLAAGKSLYITPDGELVNSKGKKVGYLVR